MTMMETIILLNIVVTIEGEDNNNKVVSNNYVLTVSEPGGVFFVSVHQQDVRCSTAPPYVDIGVTILQEKEQHSVTARVDGASDESRKHDFIGGVSNPTTTLYV